MTIPSMLTQISENHFRENSGLCYEDFVVGSVIDADHGRTMSEADCMWGSMLLGIETPLHMNRHYSGQTEFKDVIMEQIIVFGISIGLQSRLISGAAVANLEFNELKALKPVKIGDTIYVSSEILSKRESKSRPEQGIVEVKVITKNQHGEVVHTGTRKILVWKKAFRPSK